MLRLEKEHVELKQVDEDFCGDSEMNPYQEHLQSMTYFSFNFKIYIFHFHSLIQQVFIEDLHYMSGTGSTWGERMGNTPEHRDLTF